MMTGHPRLTLSRGVCAREGPQTGTPAEGVGVGAAAAAGRGAEGAREAGSPRRASAGAAAGPRAGAGGTRFGGRQLPGFSVRRGPRARRAQFSSLGPNALGARPGE